ncbi:MAG TPA: NAD(P)H-binding protein [Methylomirabilota bacterium]
MPKYVVAGVTGRVGAGVARELLSRGARATVIVRDAARGAPWAGRGAELAVGSLNDVSFLARTLRGADGVFVLLPENVGEGDFHATRRRMADAVAEAVSGCAVHHVAMLSAIAAVLPDGNGPAGDLHYGEHRLRETGATLSALRACYFQDNVGGVLTPARLAGIYPNLLPSADLPFPMIATRDVGRFAALALLDPPAASETVDLLGPAYSIRDVAGRLGVALGRTLEVVQVPPADRVPMLLGAGVPRQLAEAVVEMLDAFGAGRIQPSGDRHLTGTTTIDEVIAECVRREGAEEVSA